MVDPVHHQYFGDFTLTRVTYETWEDQRIEAVPLDA